MVRGREGPVAVHSKLGYVLSGPASVASLIAASERSVSNVTNSLLAYENNDDEVNVMLKKFWNLESLGIYEDGDVIPDLRSKVIWNKERYEVETPWKREHGVLGDNYLLAVTRLRRNIVRYKKENPELLQKYADIFKELQKDGVLEIVTKDMSAEIGKTYHMPHQLVIREDKDTTKIRAVYDCSSKMNGVDSLNDCLEVPEPLYADLYAVFIQFRIHMVGITADIEKAFLQISMAEKDRDLYRVLFVDDPFKEKPKIVVMRFTRVTFGVGPSMWHLGAVINHHLRKYEKTDIEVVRQIEKGMYADDYSGGESTDERSIVLYRKTRKIFEDAKMNMRKWRSNSQAVMHAVAEDEMTSSDEQMLLTNPVKTLGIPWNTKKDTLIFSLKSAISKGRKGPMTRNSLLSASASIYDVIGVMAPVTFTLKSMFQKVCISGAAGNELLNSEIRTQWERWLVGAEAVKEFEIPRCYIQELSSCTEISLVGFCDASEKGYAAVIYIRGLCTKNGNKEVKTEFCVC